MEISTLTQEEKERLLNIPKEQLSQLTREERQLRRILLLRKRLKFVPLSKD